MEKKPVRDVRMNKSTNETRTFAKRLIAYEELGDASSPVTRTLGFHVSDKLHPYLAALMGSGGFHALLSRALALATAEVPWLGGVQVKADGSLDGMEKIQDQLDADKILEGRVVLLAQLLGLLKAFVGEILTLRLLHDVWPRMPLNDLEFGNGVKNEKKQ
jgi:hypothetical protein